MVFLSLGLRALINVEALNMVESVGNIVRRRKAAIVYKHGNEYVVRWVPAISGESMAHSYQVVLAQVALQKGLPVCEWCAKGEFVKHADVRVFGSAEWEKRLASMLPDREEDRKGKGKKSKQQSQVDPLTLMHEVEKSIVWNCVVEDVGGFLYAGKTPVKRTSRFGTGYMVPALDAIEKAAVIDTQFHVRHAPGASQYWAQAQMPYNVEVASAVYAWSFYLDAGNVGCTSLVRRECLEPEERLKRVEAAIDALALMLDQRLFGAKRTRFNPVVGYEVILVSISKPLPFNVSPPAEGREFVSRTVERAKAFRKYTGGDVKLYAYLGCKADDKIRGLVEEASKSDKIHVYGTIYELFEAVKKDVVKWLRDTGSQA